MFVKRPKSWRFWPILVLACFLLALPSANAAVNNVEWKKSFSFNDVGRSEAVATDKATGDVYVGGRTKRVSNSNGPFIRKYDSSGTVLWTQDTTPATGEFGRVRAIAVGSQNNFYTVEHYHMNGDEHSKFVKYDPDGNELWSKTIANADARDIAIGPMGRLVVVGTVEGALPNQNSNGGIDAFIRKYSQRGGIYWTRQIGTNRTDRATAVVIDRRGRIFMGGNTQGALYGQRNMGGSDVIVRKYSSRGGIYWTRQFGRPTHDLAAVLEVDRDSNAYVGGSMGTLSYLRKVDEQGNLEWHRLWGRQRVTGGAIDSEGNPYVVGESNKSSTTKAFVKKYNSEGRVVFSRDVANGSSTGAAISSLDDLYVTGLMTARSFLAKFSGM